MNILGFEFDSSLLQTGVLGVVVLAFLYLSQVFLKIQKNSSEMQNSNFDQFHKIIKSDREQNEKTTILAAEASGGKIAEAVLNQGKEIALAITSNFANQKESDKKLHEEFTNFAKSFDQKLEKTNQIIFDGFDRQIIDRNQIRVEMKEMTQSLSEKIHQEVEKNHEYNVKQFEKILTKN